MSNVAVVDGFIKACGGGDIATALGLLDPNIEVSEPAGLPMGGEYAGIEAFVGFLQKVAATYDVNIHDVKVMDGGEFVVALIDATWTALEMGASLDTQFCELYTVTDGKISALSVFPKDTRALYDITVPAQ